MKSVHPVEAVSPTPWEAAVKAACARAVINDPTAAENPTSPRALSALRAPRTGRTRRACGPNGGRRFARRRSCWSLSATLTTIGQPALGCSESSVILCASGMCSAESRLRNTQ